MKSLTIEKVTKEKMTGMEMVKYFKPYWNDDMCEFYIWNRTCYPFSLEIVIGQLNETLGNDRR